MADGGQTGRNASHIALLAHTLAASWWLWKWLSYFGISTGAAGVALGFLIENEIGRTLLFVFSGQFVAFGLGAGVYFLIRREHLRSEYLNPFLDMTKFITTYRVLDDHWYEFVQEITVRARRSGVNTYNTKYRWTGKGNLEASIYPGTYIINEGRSSADGLFDLKSVTFDRHLGKDEERSFTLTFRMKDEEGKARAIVSKTIDDSYPNGITVKVQLPAVPMSYVEEEFFTQRSEVAYCERRYSETSSRDIVYPIPKVVFGRRYKVSWTL